MNAKPPDSLRRASFALVTYIPDPLGAFLHALRSRLPGEENPQAHITILPPRPLKGPVDRASREAQRILSEFQPFPVQLAGVNLFAGTNMLYVDIEHGRHALHELHDALNVGLLAHEEDFDFLPHLTISGPVPEDRLAAVRREARLAWEGYQAEKRFEVSEVVALLQPLDGRWDDWDRVWAQRLGQGVTWARAGSVTVG